MKNNWFILVCFFFYLKPAEYLHSQIITQNGYIFELCLCCEDYILFAIKCQFFLKNEITLIICKETKHEVDVSMQTKSHSYAAIYNIN